MKIKEVKELPPEKKEVKDDKKNKESFEEGKEESEESEESEGEEGLEEEGFIEVEQFREWFGVPAEFSSGALAFNPTLEENAWQPRNLEESLKDVSGKIETTSNTRGGGDFYKVSPGSELYKTTGGSDFYGEVGEEERMLYSPFEKSEEGRELGFEKESSLDIEGINRNFGRASSKRGDNKYTAR